MKKFLIVDDSVTMRLIIKKNLKLNLAEGQMQIKEATNKTDTMNILNEEDFDVLFLDWELADNSNGLDVVKELRGSPKFDNLKIAMITTKSSKDYIVAALQEGVNEYILKPFHEITFKNKLKALGLTEE
jgi:DNA-binding response OmpR family regulator